MIPPKTETFDVKKETNLQPKPIILLKGKSVFRATKKLTYTKSEFKDMTSKVWKKEQNQDQY